MSTLDLLAELVGAQLGRIYRDRDDGERFGAFNGSWVTEGTRRYYEGRHDTAVRTLWDLVQRERCAEIDARDLKDRRKYLRQRKAMGL